GYDLDSLVDRAADAAIEVAVTAVVDGDGMRSDSQRGGVQRRGRQYTARAQGSRPDGHGAVVEGHYAAGEGDGRTTWGHNADGGGEGHRLAKDRGGDRRPHRGYGVGLVDGLSQRRGGRTVEVAIADISSSDGVRGH